jgi:hypothetical protein
VAHVWCPTWVPGDIVILDNRRAHNGASIRERMGACGAQLIYWPPYSPDLSPMEPCWSKLRPCGVPPRRVPKTPSTAPLSMSGLRSHGRMHEDGSVIAVMPYVSSKIALVSFLSCA